MPQDKESGLSLSDLVAGGKRPSSGGTKLVKVEGKLVRVPSDASPDEIDQIAGGASTHTSPMATGSFQMHKGGPIITPADITAMAKSRTGIGSTPPLGTTPIEGMMLGAEAGKQVTPEDISRETFNDALLSPLALLSGYGTGNPVAAAKGLAGSVAGGAGGAALGRYVGGPKYGDIGAGLGGLVGGLYGGYRFASGKPLTPQISRVPGILGRLGRAMETFSEEPKTVPGAAREMAGGTAGEAGAGVEGMQAGPSQGPRNASELSSTVQRVRSGMAPGTAASPILSLEEAASRGGMASAAGGGPAYQSQAISPTQMDILRRLRAKGLNVQIPGEP